MMAHSLRCLRRNTRCAPWSPSNGTLDPKVSWGAKSRNCGHGRQRLYDWYRQSIRPHERLDRSTDRRSANRHDDGDTKIDALTSVVREAAANSGNVHALSRGKAAQQGGWNDEQLAEAFAYWV